MLGGQAAWHAHAAALSGRLARFQLHVEPDWLYALCRECGFELEQSPPSDVRAFRCEVATHDCSHQDAAVLVAAADDLVLF